VSGIPEAASVALSASPPSLPRVTANAILHRGSYADPCAALIRCTSAECTRDGRGDYVRFDSGNTPTIASQAA
jgi:hypothetical protein